MNTLKIKFAVVLGILVATFALSQGLYRNNIGTLHDSLLKSVEIIDEVHEAESFHSAMHSMLISASVYGRTQDSSFAQEYIKYRGTGETALVQMRNRTTMLPSPQHIGHDAGDSGSIIENLVDSFQVYKSTLDKIFALNAMDVTADLSAGREIFDNIFHKYYPRCIAHTASGLTL